MFGFLAISTMFLKKSYPALEYVIFLEENSGKMLFYGLPDKLLEELNDFVKRNAIVAIDLPEGKKYYCCLNCLKAHALKKARQINLDKERIELLLRMFNTDSFGHNGYYTDSENLIKI